MNGPLAILTVSDDSLQEVPEHPRGANKHTTGVANKSPGWFKTSKKGSLILFFVCFTPVMISDKTVEQKKKNRKEQFIVLDQVTTKRILERLGIQTSSSFVKI